MDGVDSIGWRPMSILPNVFRTNPDMAGFWIEIKRVRAVMAVRGAAYCWSLGFTYPI